jgi:hypothetical protein
MVEKAAPNHCLALTFAQREPLLAPETIKLVSMRIHPPARATIPHVIGIVANWALLLGMRTAQLHHTLTSAATGLYGLTLPTKRRGEVSALVTIRFLTMIVLGILSHLTVAKL